MKGLIEAASQSGAVNAKGRLQLGAVTEGKSDKGSLVSTESREGFQRELKGKLEVVGKKAGVVANVADSTPQEVKAKAPEAVATELIAVGGLKPEEALGDSVSSANSGKHPGGLDEQGAEIDGALPVVDAGMPVIAVVEGAEAGRVGLGRGEVVAAPQNAELAEGKAPDDGSWDEVVRGDRYLGISELITPAASSALAGSMPIAVENPVLAVSGRYRPELIGRSDALPNVMNQIVAELLTPVRAKAPELAVAALKKGEHPTLGVRLPRMEAQRESVVVAGKAQGLEASVVRALSSSTPIGLVGSSSVADSEFKGVLDAASVVQKLTQSHLTKVESVDRPVSAQVAHQNLEGRIQDIGKMLRHAVANEVSSLTIRLKPAELGAVEVSVSDLGAGLHVTVRGEKAETVSLLSSMEAQLRADLRGAGGSAEFSFGGQGRGDSSQGAGAGLVAGEVDLELSAESVPLIRADDGRFRTVV